VSERYSYRNLILWQRAQDLAHEVIHITKRLPSTWASGVIARQIIASATSIAANIAEGHGRYTYGAHRNHLLIARGSAAETDSWLDLMRREGWLSEQEEQNLHVQCTQIIAMLTSKINQLQSRESGDDGRVREPVVDYITENSLYPQVYDPEDYI
jgi:four helix bundle protein